MDVLMPDGTIISGVPEGITQKDLLARYGRYQANVEAKTEAVAKNSPFDVMSGVPIGPEAGIASLPQVAKPPEAAPEESRALTAEKYLAEVEARKQESPDRSVSDAVLDSGITLLKGTIGLPEAFVGLADIPSRGAIGKFLERSGYKPKEASAILDSYLSEAQQAANRKVSEAKGFVPTIQASLQNPSTIATSIGESLPQMIGGAGVARGLLKAAPALGPVIAGGLGEGILGAGSAAENIRAQNADKLLTTKQSLAALGSGAGTALFGVAGGRLAQKLGLDDIDTLLAAGGGRGGSKSVADFAKRALGSGVSEGVFEEMPQSAQETMWMNYATDKPLLEGVSEASAKGLLAGFGMGVMGGGLGALKQAQQDQRDRYQRPVGGEAEQIARQKGFLTPQAEPGIASLVPPATPSEAPIVGTMRMNIDGEETTKVTRQDGSVELDGVQVIAPKPPAPPTQPPSAPPAAPPAAQQPMPESESMDKDLMMRELMGQPPASSQMPPVSQAKTPNIDEVITAYRDDPEVLAGLLADDLNGQTHLTGEIRQIAKPARMLPVTIQRFSRRTVAPLSNKSNMGM